MELINEDNTCADCGLAPIEVKGWDTCQKCYDKLPSVEEVERMDFEALLGDIVINL